MHSRVDISWAVVVLGACLNMFFFWCTLGGVTTLSRGDPLLLQGFAHLNKFYWITKFGRNGWAVVFVDNATLWSVVHQAVNQYSVSWFYFEYTIIRFQIQEQPIATTTSRICRCDQLTQASLYTSIQDEIRRGKIKVSYPQVYVNYSVSYPL